MKKQLVRVSISLALGMIFPSFAFAFPGMIRHGYVHCTSCHVQPTGGGVLTRYGRELSQEILSSASGSSEGQFLFGAFQDRIPSILGLGGDFRAIQTYKDNPVYREKRFFLMQADAEVAVSFDRLLLDASFGVYDREARSLRHYVLFQFDEENAIRFGRFMPAFGINTSEHTITTRRNLGFDQSSEGYNLEFSMLKDRWSAFATLLLGKSEGVHFDDGVSFGVPGSSEQGVMLRGSVFLAENYELGMSYLYGETSLAHRHVTGPYFILGFTPKLYLLSEADVQFRRPNGRDSVSGLFVSQRLDYEPWRGVHFYLLQESARPDFQTQADLTSRFGLGTVVYPRPHWELDLRWYRQKARPDASAWGDFAWLLAHFYL